MLAVREYFERARRYPLRHRLLFDIGDHGGLESEARRVFDTVTDLVAAAQHVGEIQDGDPTQISALICSAVHGMVLLEQSGIANIVRAPNDVDSLSQCLLGLITNKSGHQDAQARPRSHDYPRAEAAAVAALSAA